MLNGLKYKLMLTLLDISEIKGSNPYNFLPEKKVAKKVT